MWKVRQDEPDYAFLNDRDSASVNYYEAPIDLIARSGGEAPSDREMFINEEPGVGCNPNRNKQHAFHFTADNCIGCHACEAACSEKNDNPSHISFRSVGYVEGGTFPNFTRMNISMACNHCDDPVCLKGCPTAAYTKHAEYGAVLQDPDTCFGCGYCTWVCPYNAPQLDPVQGQVSKCNMCVDRLEVGLKPACVTACLGNALNFGVVDNTPDNRQQAAVQLPGFPDPEITRPNIRFQQTKKMPDELARTDGMPVKYHQRDDGSYRPVVDQKKGKERYWNLAKLSSRENPLVIFTLSTQAAVGAFCSVVVGGQLGIEAFAALTASVMYVPLLLMIIALTGLGLLMSTVHLGKPRRFYRGFNNLRYSPVCREGLGICVFVGCVALHLLCVLPANPVLQTLLGSALATSGALAKAAMFFAALAVPAGLVGLYYMVRCYRIPARPFWNHSHTGFAFAGNSLILGAVVIALFGAPSVWLDGGSVNALLTAVGTMLMTGILLEGFGLLKHAKDMNIAGNEGAASHYIQCTRFGKSYRARNGLLLANLLVLAVLVAIAGNDTAAGLLAGAAWVLVMLSAVLTAVVGRALFYVLVVPTTMPGAFFWKNKDFEQHARDIGLAAMPQVGIAPEGH